MPKFLLDSASPENQHNMPALDNRGSPIMTLDHNVLDRPGKLARYLAMQTELMIFSATGISIL